MAHFVIPSDSALNIARVNEVMETDPVIAAFINGYFQQFLENDQALLNLINERTKKVDLAAVATSGSYKDLKDQPTIPSGAAANCNVANNDTTTVSGSVADARIVKVHGDEIDLLTEKSFLQKYELFNQETVITEGANGGKVITVTSSEATTTTTFVLNQATGAKTITEVIVPKSGNFKYTKTTVITPTSTGKKIKESFVKEAK